HRRRRPRPRSRPRPTVRIPPRFRSPSGHRPRHPLASRDLIFWAVAFSLSDLEHPIVQAPMGGGPSTPALAVAVCEAGGLGFLAAGYRTADAVQSDIEEVRGLTSRPFGLNLFVPGPATGDAAAVERYAATLAGEAGRLGVELGEPRYDGDRWDDKLALARDEEVPVVSFTFG